MNGLLSNRIEDNRKKLNDLLHPGDNFDIINRNVMIGGKEAAIYFIDGFTKDEMIQRLLQYFYSFKPEAMPATAHDFTKNVMPYTEVEISDDIDLLVKNLLSGVPLLLIDGYDKAIMIDCRTYPARGVEEPEKDRVMRGSRDGFVETLVMNTALIRRRIRTPDFCVNIMVAGESSRTDIAICYMDSRVDHGFLDEIKQRIGALKVDALTMNQESLAECIYKGSWLNPFPKFKYSERPDTAAASILEGNIVILVDNSPAAMILPASVFNIIEEADDYYFPPVTATYLRLTRFITNLVALLLTPTWLLFLEYPDWVPKWLSFVTNPEQANVPIMWQLLILEFAIDGLRLAALNTPNMLSTPLSVIAGIVMGDFAVSSGWFSPQSMLYMAFVVVATYTQASFELGYALKFLRMILLVTTGFFGIYGYIGGLLIALISLVCNKTVAGRSYLAPLFPVKGKQILRRFFRVSLPKSEQKK